MQPVPIIELLIFAVLAAVVLYNLYAVLGRRIGRQPGEAAQPAATRPAMDSQSPRIEPAVPEVELGGLAALKARDPGFDADKFLEGAKAAFKMIVRAFSTGDRQTLKGLVSSQVMTGFERVMAARESDGLAETAEFVHEPRADIETGEVEGDLERVKVRFLAEFRNRSTGPAGEQVGDRRTAEAWTFERNLNSRDPNWILVRVDAAEV